jgi:ABC-type polysaccharide/polyol phosphate transport system ATPase subunit
METNIFYPSETNIENFSTTPAFPKTEYAIEFENVSRRYRLHHEPKLTLQDRVVSLFRRNSSYEEFYALKNISFRLEKGKTLGIIGQNGAGKSTLLKLATRILEPSSGSIRVNGRVSAMLELGTGFHPELTARDNIYLNGAFYGFNREAMDERYERIVEFSELGKFIDTPVKHFSSGMYMRLGFAVAITVSPDILIIDEVLAVGDAAFGRKCHRAIEDLKNQGRTMLFVSHAAAEISRFCDEALYLSKGEIVATGKPGEVLDEYMMASIGPSYLISEIENKSEAEVKVPLKSGTSQPVSQQSNNLALATHHQPDLALEEALLPKVEAALLSVDVSRYLTISPGISSATTNWQINLDHLFNKGTSATTEYYLAILNTHHQPVKFKMVGYKQATGLLDQTVGALNQQELGEFEIGTHRSMLLKLEKNMLDQLSMLRVKANKALGLELIDYQLDLRPVVQEVNKSLAAIPSTLWLFPFCDIRSNNICRLEVFNSNTETVQMHITLFRDWGEPIFRLRGFQCAPNSRTTLNLNEELGSGEGERAPGERFFGGIMLDASCPVTVERHSLQLSPLP